MSTFAWDKPEGEHIERDGLSIHYLRGGNASDEAPTILMVHGLTSSARSWEAVAGLLAEECHLVSVDLRGHGDSDWAGKRPGGYRSIEFAKDLVHLVEVVGRGPVHLLGHSLGARVGFVLAGSHPRTVASLILSDTLPDIKHEGLLFLKKMIGERTRSAAFRNEEEAVAQLQADHPGWRPGLYEQYVRATTVENWVGKLIYKCDPQLYWITTGSASRADNDYFWEMASSLVCPTLVLWGRESFMVDQTIVDQMLRSTPTATAVAFETGHYILREEPEQWATTILQFVRQQTAEVA